MKRAFFITLGIYLSLFAIINAIDFTVKPKKTVSLQHIKIKKCSCVKCTCKKCPEHPKKPPPPPPEPKEEIVQWQPKKAPIKKLEKKLEKPKKKVKKQHKKLVRKKVKRKVKKVTKKTKKTVKKVTKKITKKAAAKPIISKPKSKPAPCKECVKSSKEAPKPPKPSYQKRYLQTYALKIKEAIIRHLYYPRIARKTKKQGIVVIRFVLLSTKEVQNITIVQSSGYKILDKAAKKTIKAASKEFPAPTEKITIQIPIEYKLR